MQPSGWGIARYEKLFYWPRLVMARTGGMYAVANKFSAQDGPARTNLGEQKAGELTSHTVHATHPTASQDRAVTV
jgi:hypothetical protein